MYLGQGSSLALAVLVGRKTLPEIEDQLEVREPPPEGVVMSKNQAMEVTEVGPHLVAQLGKLVVERHRVLEQNLLAKTALLLQVARQLKLAVDSQGQMVDRRR